MAHIYLTFQCGCFKRSDYQDGAAFATLEEAKIKASEMVEDMNENFCGKHKFSIIEDGNSIKISVEEN